MLPTSDAGFGFGQDVTGGGSSQETVISNKDQLRNALRNLGPGTSLANVVLTLNDADYDFKGETEREFRISAKNLTIRSGFGQRVTLKNLGLVLDLVRIDNILIKGLAFHSDGDAEPNDAILFDAEGQTEVDAGNLRSDVRITRCTFDGYKDQAIEIRTRFSALLATIDNCYFFDSNPGQGDFVNRGAINVASVIREDGRRTTANSFVTVAYNYFENVWRRSPRAASDGTRVHAFNNLLYRWGFQKDGFTETPSWNGMPTELNFHKANGDAVTAVIQANRFIPWAAKQNKAIDPDAGTQVDIGKSTSLANRFDMPNGKTGNTDLEKTVTKGNKFKTISVSDWYTNLGLKPPTVLPRGASTG